MQNDAGMEQQACITMPVLPGTDGVRRMGKSLGNYIGVDEDPREMYGKAMSIPDAVMRQYFELLTEFSVEEIDEFLSDRTHPRDAKAALALRLVEMYHSPDAARRAAEEFDRVFRKGKMPEEIPPASIPGDLVEGGTAEIIKLLRAAGLVSSNSDARRMIQQGAVSVNGERITRIDARVPVEDGTIVQVGKRRFASVKLS